MRGWMGVKRDGWVLVLYSTHDEYEDYKSNESKYNDSIRTDSEYDSKYFYYNICMYFLAPI